MSNVDFLNNYTKVEIANEKKFRNTLQSPNIQEGFHYISCNSFMRKHLVILLMLTLPVSLFTQTRIGLKGGVNMTNFIDRPDDDGDRKWRGSFLFRFNIGTQIEVPLNDDDNWFLYTGPYYTGKGSGTGRKLFSAKDDTLRTFLNYIEIPINVGHKFSAESENRFSVSGGAYIGYGFNGRRLWKGGSPPTDRNLHRKGSYYKRFDIGFAVSGMLEHKEKFGIRFDYSRSLIDISRKKWKEINNVFGFSFFWYLPQKSRMD